MKKIIILSLVLLGFSCANVDLVPLDRPSEATYYNSFDEYNRTALAAYSSFNKLYQASSAALNVWSPIFKITLAPTDNSLVTSWDSQETTVTGLQEYNDLNFDPTLRPLSRIYHYIYEGIFRTNVVLERLDAGVEEGILTSAEASRLNAEMKFLRAFYHFQALKIWGTPPMVLKRITSFNESAVPNTDKTVLLNQILSDFQEAFDGLPTREAWGSENLGRASKWAAMAYMGKVNVWKEDWPAAITAFESVIGSGQYELLPDYEDVFAADNENNRESIFELQFGDNPPATNIWVLEGQPGGEGFQPAVQSSMRLYWTMVHRDGFPGRRHVLNGQSIGFNTRGLYESTEEFANIFESGDTRKVTTVYSEGEDYEFRDGNTFPYTLGEITDDNGITYDYTLGVNIKKYIGVRGITPNGPLAGRGHLNNERYYRYAEMLLLYAEALIESGRTGEAMDVINNQIRSRAGLGATTITDPVEALRHEKRLELAFEAGQRFFDIQRWDIGAQVFGSKWNPRNVVFPFPSEEITRSGGVLQQNSGY